MALTLRLDDDEQEALRVTAEREHRSMNDVAREAIRRYTGGHDARRTEALSQIVAEDRQLLERLRQ